MNELEKLIAQRNKAIANMRTMLDVGLDTAEDELTYERYEKEEINLSKNIARAERLADTEQKLAQVEETPTVSVQEQGTREGQKKLDDAKRYTECFENYLRKPLDFMTQETRAILNTGTGSEGGFLVPTNYLTTVIEKLLDVSVMRTNSTVSRTTSTTKIPLGETDPVFAIIAENGAYPTSDITFGQKTIDAFKIGGIIKSSDELLNDAFINLENYITGKIVRGISIKEETLFTTGTGSGEAEGIITGSALGDTTAAIAAVTADEMLEFMADVKAVYRSRPDTALMINSKTQLALRKLKDSQGAYLWQNSLQLGAPASFDGQRVLINEDMPDLGTGNKFAGFGDMSFYEIFDRGSMEIKRLDELFAGNGQVGFRVNKRTDAKLLVSEAFKHLKNA